MGVPENEANLNFCIPVQCCHPQHADYNNIEVHVHAKVMTCGRGQCVANYTLTSDYMHMYVNESHKMSVCLSV